MSLRTASALPRTGDSNGLDVDRGAAASPAVGWLLPWCRSALHAQWSQLSAGQLVVREGPESFVFGRAGDLGAEIQILDPAAYQSAALGGTVGAAESYIRGEWTSPDLVAVVRLFCREAEAIAPPAGWWAAIVGMARRWGHWWRGNSLSGSRRNIADHYDLGNDLFAQFLDETMAYSAAHFPTAETTLHAAQLAKFDRICRELQLSPADHLLEIGCGWGGLALHAAQHYGCRVTATTISAEQYSLARERVRAAGLSDRITLLQDDYRELRGTYDKLVSIEMIEAVGHEHLSEFFCICGERLTDRGAMLLQAIVMPDRHYERYLQNVDFIQQYVFPGGHLPSLGAIGAALGERSALDITRVESFPLDYARTLALWRERFTANRTPLRELGLTDASLRLWDYYFAYCEAAFLERQINVVRMLLTRPRWGSADAN